MGRGCWRRISSSRTRCGLRRPRGLRSTGTTMSAIMCRRTSALWVAACVLSIYMHACRLLLFAHSHAPLIPPALS